MYLKWVCENIAFITSHFSLMTNVYVREMLTKQFAFLIALDPLSPLKFEIFLRPLQGFKEIEFSTEITKLSAIFIQNQ